MEEGRLPGDDVGVQHHAEPSSCVGGRVDLRDQPQQAQRQQHDDAPTRAATRAAITLQDVVTPLARVPAQRHHACGHDHARSHERHHGIYERTTLETSRPQSRCKCVKFVW